MQNTERQWREVQSAVPRNGNPMHHLHGHLAELFSYDRTSPEEKHDEASSHDSDSSMDE